MWTITRDGLLVQTVDDEYGVLRYFHTHHSYSAHHGIEYEGYTVRDDEGNIVLF